MRERPPTVANVDDRVRIDREAATRGRTGLAY
jgi:hypothetical protein